MKNIIKSVLLLGALTTQLFAASVQISGTVSPVSSLTVGNINTLQNDDIVTGTTDFTVTTINEKSNKKAGYTVTLQSQNAGSTATAKLIGQSTGDSINYTIKYGGSSVTLVSGVATVTNTSAKTGGSGVDKNLQITINGNFASSDTYTDTLTITLTNK